MKDILAGYVNQYVKFSNVELDHFFDSLLIKDIKKKEFLLREGEVCRCKYFIIEGLTRTYHTDRKSNEKITQFGIENWWVTDIESFKNGTLTYQNIQALENTKTLCLHKDKLQKLYTELPKLERFFRLVTENWLIAIQKRSNFYLKLDSKLRYEMFVQAFPGFAQRVPQYMIASYLEITPEYLSALRSNS